MTTAQEGYEYLQRQQRHERAMRIIRRWRLLDDEFMKRCLKDNIPAVECILRIIMEMPTLKVLSVKIEDTIPSLSGRGVRLDVHATDADGIEYDIEVQRADKGAGCKRARFNSSMLDINSLPKGDDYEKLPRAYVIFITENDVLRHKLPRYHIGRIIKETGEPFDDEAEIIYVNGAYEADDDIGRLMNDFRSADPEDMYYKELRDTVDRYKNNPVEVENMGKELESWIAEERAEAIAASIKNLMETMQITAEKAMDLLKVPSQDRSQLMAML